MQKKYPKKRVYTLFAITTAQNRPKSVHVFLRFWRFLAKKDTLKTSFLGVFAITTAVIAIFRGVQFFGGRKVKTRKKVKNPCTKMAIFGHFSKITAQGIAFLILTMCDNYGCSEKNAKKSFYIRVSENYL